MVEALTSPLATTITRIGYEYQHRSYGSRIHEFRAPCRFLCCCACLGLETKTNGRRTKIYGPNVLAMSEGWFPRFGVGQPMMPQMNFVFRSANTDHSCVTPPKVVSVDFRSVCAEDTSAQNGKEELGANPTGKKLLPWRDLASQGDLHIQTGGVSQHSRVSKGSLTVNENRLIFLEETDEEILSKRILRLSRSNKVTSALELYNSMEFSGLRPNLHACNSLISCLLRKGMLEDALRIFDVMMASDITTGHTYSLVLKAIADARGCDAALDMFEKLVEESDSKKDFDVVVYNTMISVCGKANNWVQTERIWRSLKDDGHIGTTITYRLLVCIFVRCGQNELALDAYHEMLQNGLQPSDDAMQAIIGACMKEGMWDLALSVFQNMLNSGIRPNIIACNALINSLGKAGKVELAFKVYGLMKSFGHTPDAYTWNALLGALYRANQHADALRLFESIQKGQSSVLNLYLYNTALMSCQRLGLWDRALQLLWQMEASSLSISTATYNLVIGACEVAKKPKVALQVYEHMAHQKHSPDTFTLLSLIRGCIWGSLWNEVDEILNQAVPSGSLYNAAIHGMCLRGKIGSAKTLYMKMRDIGLRPDGKTRALMLQNLRKVSFKQGNRWYLQD